MKDLDVNGCLYLFLSNINFFYEKKLVSPTHSIELYKYEISM